MVTSLLAACHGNQTQPQTDDDTSPTTQDVDADGDGALASQDCNDADAAIYPGAAEILSDGVDQNCNGHDDEDVDADTYTVLAGDCDDGSATVYPGAWDPVNGVDDNCDGQADEESAIEDIAHTIFSGDEAGDVAGFSLAHLGDVSGDGKIDFIVGAYKDADPNVGGAYVVHGSGTWLAAESLVGRSIIGWDSNGGNFGYDVLGLDNGDFLVSEPALNLYAGRPPLWQNVFDAGAVYLVANAAVGESSAVDGIAATTFYSSFPDTRLGNSLAQTVAADGTKTLWMAAATTVADGAEATLYQPQSYGVTAAEFAQYADVDELAETVITTEADTDSLQMRLLAWDRDGDGAAEALVVAMPGADTVVQDGGALGVFLAPEDLTGEVDFTAADILLTGSRLYGQAGLGLGVLADRDGDGVAELFVGGVGTGYVVMSASLADSGSHDLEDGAAIFADVEDDAEAGLRAVDVPDVNGDSYTDLLLGAPGANQGRGLLYLWLGGGLAQGDDISLPEGAVVLTAARDGEGLGQALLRGDFDANGTDEVLVGAPAQFSDGSLEGRVYRLEF